MRNMHSIGLDGDGGMSRRQFLQLAAAGTTGMALSACSLTNREDQGGKGMSQPPNIVFITTDEQRYDTLGVAGNRIIRTPHLDRMASEGVRFSNTYCQGPLCQPARASLLTGSYLHNPGITWNRMDMKPEMPTMMKQLQAAGYTTAKFGKTHFYSKSPAGTLDMRDNAPFLRSFGLDDVLEEYDRYIHTVENITTPYTAYLRDKDLLDAYLEGIPSLAETRSDVTKQYAGKAGRLEQAHDLTSFIADRSIDWLRNYSGEKPFFLWVSIVAPHPPLTDDPTWAQVYKDADIPLGPSKRPPIPDNAWGRYLGSWLKGIGSDTLTPDRVLNAARHYYGMISLIDQKIGDIVAALDSQGLGDNTWLIFTSDHGDMMGDHGMMFKNVFYKGAVLVPHIIRPPKGMTPSVVDTPTQHIDITATIIDIANADPPDGMRGRSLVPAMAGRDGTREVAFSELAGHGNRGNFLVMAANDRYRYVYDTENDIPCELFDLQEDPYEMNNLVDDPGYQKLRKDLHRDYLVPFINGEIG